MAKDRQKPGCVTAGGGRGGFSGAALPEALLRRVATMVQGQVLCLGEARREAPGATCGAPWQRWAGTLQGCSNCVSTGLQLLVPGPLLLRTCDGIACKTLASTALYLHCRPLCTSVHTARQLLPGGSFQHSAAVLHPATRLNAPRPRHRARLQRADAPMAQRRTAIRRAVIYSYRCDVHQKN